MAITSTSSKQWCWSWGRRILTLSLCYSLCSISAMHNHNFIRAVLSGWSTGSGFDLVGHSSHSSKHLCIFGLYGAMWVFLIILTSLYLGGVCPLPGGLTNDCPSVLWQCWLGHLTCTIVPDMTYNVFGRTLNPTQSWQIIWLSCVRVSQLWTWLSIKSCYTYLISVVRKVDPVPGFDLADLPPREVLVKFFQEQFGGAVFEVANAVDDPRWHRDAKLLQQLFHSGPVYSDHIHW